MYKIDLQTSGQLFDDKYANNNNFLHFLIQVEYRNK